MQQIKHLLLGTVVVPIFFVCVVGWWRAHQGNSKVSSGMNTVAVRGTGIQHTRYE